MAQPPPERDVDKMCNRLMWLLVHELSVSPQKREWDKDPIWREASFINGVYEKFDLDLKDTVFRKLVDRGDIEDLADRVRITAQGAIRPENRPPFVRTR